MMGHRPSRARHPVTDVRTLDGSVSCWSSDFFSLLEKRCDVARSRRLSREEAKLLSESESSGGDPQWYTLLETRFRLCQWRTSRSLLELRHHLLPEGDVEFGVSVWPPACVRVCSLAPLQGCFGHIAGNHCAQVPNETCRKQVLLSTGHGHFCSLGIMVLTINSGTAKNQKNSTPPRQNNTENKETR